MKNQMLAALSLILAGALSTPAVAQTPAQPATQPAGACTAPASFSTTQLYGRWQLVLWADGGSAEQPGSTGTLQFERHPEYPGSVRGKLQRSADGKALRALVSGDAIDGAFSLDESADGVNMDAVWPGCQKDFCRHLLKAVFQSLI